MTTRRECGGRSLIDVLDRVLSKGIGIDHWERLSGPGINTLEVRIVVATSEAYLEHWQAVSCAAAPPSPSSVMSSGEALRASSHRLARGAHLRGIRRRFRQIQIHSEPLLDIRLALRVQ